MMNALEIMKKNKLLLIPFGILSLSLIGLLLYFILKPTPVVIPDVKGPQVIITNNGFVPQTLKIKAGETVTWTNSDSVSHQISADPYPTRTSLPELFSLSLLSTESYSFTFNQSGTYTYHDYLNPLLFKATIIVE